MKKTIISARDLCKSYVHNGVQNHVVNGMDLDVYEGDFTVIMGASGSGKSTTLYMLSGMDRVTSGQIIFDGRDITKMKEKELTGLRHGKFGFVFQQMHLVSNLTIFENVTVPGYLNKETSAKETEERAEKLLKQIRAVVIKNIGKKEGVVIATGIADYDSINDKTLSDVFERADAKMYENKKFLKYI